jgi:hypothetical protein
MKAEMGQSCHWQALVQASASIVRNCRLAGTARQAAKGRPVESAQESWLPGAETPGSSRFVATEKETPAFCAGV